jgi:hypothetical protein
MSELKPMYWTPTIEEAKTFLTYSFKTHPMDDNVLVEFYKKGVPVDVKCPAKTKEDDVEKAEEWWKKTNKEDLIVLERERDAFERYYSSEKSEIMRHL